MRIVLLGSVTSSRITLEKLLEHNCNVVGVFGLEPENPSALSGYCRLDDISNREGIPYTGFQHVNQCEEELAALRPDLLFVIGLSQLVSDSIIAIPTHGCVGFHPTMLPEHRGRAPLAWLIMNTAPGAATYFRIEKGVDDGPIYIQEPFVITEDDDATSARDKLHEAMNRALDQWLPTLRSGQLDAREQDHSQATYTGKRNAEDGCLDWQTPALSTLRLIRASTRPHPGAFTYSGDVKIRVWQAHEVLDAKIQGVPGRILEVSADGSILVQCNPGVLRLTDYCDVENSWQPRTGQLLGYSVQCEIHELRQKIQKLTKLVDNMGG